MEEKITILVVEPKKRPQAIQINDTLEDMQKVVGGYIELMHPFNDNTDIFSNEEGKLIGLPLNRAIYGENKEILEVLAGTFFISATDGEGKAISLTDEQINHYSKLFYDPEGFCRLGNNIVVFPILPDEEPSEYIEEVCDIFSNKEVTADETFSSKRCQEGIGDTSQLNVIDTIAKTLEKSPKEAKIKPLEK